MMLLTTLLLLLPIALAAPIPNPKPLFGIHIGEEGDTTDNAPTPVSDDTVTSQLLRPALFSRLSYCSAPSVTALNCGAPCDAVKEIKVLEAGGDDGAIPGFFIATDPTTESVVVAHQGTDPTQLVSIANDAQIAQVEMNSTLFPKAADGARVHEGFQKTQGRTADLVLSTVQSALASTKYNRVLVTGHSLGAAVATLDAHMLKMNLPSTVEINAVLFGLPRVGNEAFASMTDASFPTFSRITNQDDPVPIVPPRFLGYQHPSGEIHITSVDKDSGKATLVACSGQENENCAEGNSALDGSIANHLGPYFNDISFGADACPA
ncbi:alpha/beta-hydrolase [Panus rudis PR-1116 ss-1]|nr:alpha/beta-hydrolase [Panus rudis PR-1116 ss-1]